MNNTDPNEINDWIPDEELPIWMDDDLFMMNMDEADDYRDEF